jgi:hypothetical protein
MLPSEPDREARHPWRAGVVHNGQVWTIEGGYETKEACERGIEENTVSAFCFKVPTTK